MIVANIMLLVVFLLYIMSFIGLALLIVVLFKLNKALNIWLEKNKD